MCPPVSFQFRGSGEPSDLNAVPALRSTVDFWFVQLFACCEDRRTASYPLRTRVHRKALRRAGVDSGLPVLCLVDPSLPRREGVADSIFQTRKLRTRVTLLLAAKICQNPHVPAKTTCCHPVLLLTARAPLALWSVEHTQRAVPGHTRRLWNNSICACGEGLSRLP